MDIQLSVWQLLRECLKRWKKSINCSHYSMGETCGGVKKEASLQVKKITRIEHCMWCHMLHISTIFQ
jgi:hypothetical protein